MAGELVGAEQRALGGGTHGLGRRTGQGRGRPSGGRSARGPRRRPRGAAPRGRTDASSWAAAPRPTSTTSGAVIPATAGRRCTSSAAPFASRLASAEPRTSASLAVEAVPRCQCRSRRRSGRWRAPGHRALTSLGERSDTVRVVTGLVLRSVRDDPRPRGATVRITTRGAATVSRMTAPDLLTSPLHERHVAPGRQDGRLRGLGDADRVPRRGRRRASTPPFVSGSASSTSATWARRRSRAPARRPSSTPA